MSKREQDSDEDVCSFFLERKKRHCRMRKGEGMEFCPHHSYLGSYQDPIKGARVPCPLDSSHFCYESKLEKHLKKCNAREKEKPDFYVENVNGGCSSGSNSSSSSSSDEDNKKIRLQDISDEELLSLIQKVKTLSEGLDDKPVDLLELHPAVKTQMAECNDGFNTFKHMRQQGALLYIMDQNNLLDEGKCFVEFGAGSGKLMFWMLQCTPDREQKAFLLIDKVAQRHKADNKFKDSGLQVQRLRIDIQHLLLGKFKNIGDRMDKVVGVSKHLCGDATDLTLRCLVNTLYSKDENDVKTKHKALGVLIALCCHHRCTWQNYVGQDFMEQRDVTEREFDLMCCMSSWATCGKRKGPNGWIAREVNEHIPDNSEDALGWGTDVAALPQGVRALQWNAREVNEHIPDNPDEAQLNRYQKLELSYEEREAIGAQCKRLIDAGRDHFLRGEGYDTKFIGYVHKSVSPENVAILATLKKAPA